MTIYLVIAYKIDPEERHDIRKAFTKADDGYAWIHRQDNPNLYYLEALEVQKEDKKEVHP